jgi:tripartite-type tricarboxylate transporter receptor subunit TctC
MRRSLICLSVLVLASEADAQTVAEFYKGKTVEIYIGTSAGGGYDAYGRLLARHMGKHLPGNPNVVPQNMPGSGGLRLANYLFNAAPKTGTAIGIFNRGVAFDPLLGNKLAQFDATQFNWIGSTNNEISVCVAWHTSGITNWEQVRTRELVVGASGPSADTYQFPKIANGVLGTKFKIIAGYPGGNDIDIAMERQEVHGRCGWSWTSAKATRGHWFTDKKVTILFQMGLDRHPELPTTNLIMDLVKTDEERTLFRLMFARQVMAWPFAAPPGIPKDRVDALRAAFTKTVTDKDFLADAEKGSFEVRPVPGTDIQKLIVDIYGTPPAIAKKAGQLLQ